jgi:ATP-dependent Zn protease
MILLSIGMVALGAAILVVCAVRTGTAARLPAEDPDWPRRDVPRDERTAAHEAGHAILAWISPSVVRIKQVTIDAEDGGVVSFDRTEIRNELHVWDSMAIGLAGIAGEGIAFGCVKASGCGSDLRRARSWAEELSAEGDAMASFPWKEADAAASTLDIGAMFAEPPSPAVAAVLNKAYRRSKAIVGLRRDKFDALRRLLLERRTLTSDEVESVLGPRPWARR